MATSSFRSKILLLTVSVAALSACSGKNPPAGAQAEAPPPPPPTQLTLSDQAAMPPETTTLSTSAPLMASDVPAEILLANSAATVTMEDRVAKLESDVEGLRSGYDEMIPVFKGLVSTNERITALLDKMEGKKAATPVAAPVPETKPEAETAPAPTAIPNDTTASASSVKAVRIGEHANKTRIVLDMMGKTAYEAEVDNSEKLLVIRLVDAEWEAGSSATLTKSPMISTWSHKDGEGSDMGQTLAIQLKKEAKILDTQVLKAEGKEPGKLVIDIAPTS